MIFLSPDYLLFMIIPSIIFFFFIIKHKSNVNTIFDKEVLKRLTFDDGRIGKMGRNLMLFAAFFLMIIALSRPVIEKGEVTIKTKSIDMMIALDISKSMLASDIYPNRLEFAKKKMGEFIDAFKEANIGVIAFSSEGFLVSPMTQDSTTLKYLINNLSLQSLSTNGTNLLIPIKKGESFLKESKQKIVIIFTDGGDNKEFKKELEATKEAGVFVYIYATATNQGAPIQEKGISIKDKEGNIVITKLNEKIKTLAIDSGGAYIVGGFKDDSIELLVKDIKKKFQMQDINSREVKEYKELFYYPLGLAILFLLLSFSSFPRKSVISLFILILLMTQNQNLQAGIFDFQTIDKANAAYQNREYKDAVKIYEEVVKLKSSPESYYDLANALYKDKQYEKALQTYQKVKTDVKNLEYKKLFNSANTLYALKKYEDALDAFEKAKKLKTEQDLEDNIELTKKMIKKREEKKKEEKEEKKKKDDKEEEKQKEQEKKDEDGDKKEKKNGDEKNKKEQKDEEPKKKKEEKISEKEARKWEERLENAKPKTMPMQFQNKDIKRRVDEKPW